MVSMTTVLKSLNGNEVIMMMLGLQMKDVICSFVGMVLKATLKTVNHYHGLYLIVRNCL